jgi:hypothetical protein
VVEGTLDLLDPEILNLLHKESLILDPCIKYLFDGFTQAFEASMMAAADIFCAVSRSPSAAILKRYHLLFSTSIFSDESNNNGSTDLPFKSTIFLPVRPFLWSQLTSI